MSIKLKARCAEFGSSCDFLLLSRALIQEHITQTAAESAKLKWTYTNPCWPPPMAAKQLSSMCVCVSCTHCQVSDRFLFVHKSHSVISSIFKTIKQWRENGWLGNPWILICQHNEIGMLVVCGVCVCARGSRKWLQTCKRNKLLPPFTPGCSHSLPSHVDTMSATHCQRSVTAANLEVKGRLVAAEEAAFQVSLPQEKSMGFRQTLLWSHLQTRAAFQSVGIRPMP